MATTPFSVANKNINGAFTFGSFPADGLTQIDWNLTSGDAWTNPPGTQITVEVDIDLNDGLGMRASWGPATYQQGGMYARNGFNGGLPCGVIGFEPPLPAGTTLQITGSTSARISLGANGTTVTTP